MPPSPPNAVTDRGDTQQHAMQHRYGAPRKQLSRRTRVLLIGSALVVVVGMLLYFTIGNSVGQLRFKDVGYSIDSDTSASVDYEVTKDFDVTAQCMITVLDESYAIVGARTVTIGPHEGSGPADRSQYLRTDLRTEARGVTGIVDDCWEIEDD